MIAIIDYGAGNLFSVQNALTYLNETFCITRLSLIHISEPTRPY